VLQCGGWCGASSARGGRETPEQASFLSDCGCDSAQGFYYSKPITQEEFDKMLVEVNK